MPWPVNLAVGVAACDETTDMTTDHPKQTRPKRRWYQYSLRTAVNGYSISTCRPKSTAG